MLESIIYDVAFFGGSCIADNVSTYIFARKPGGIEEEANLDTREGMEKYGIGKYLTRNAISSFWGGLKVGVFLFGVDSVLGIEDSMINFHNISFYGYGGAKYVVALGNILDELGMEKTAAVIKLPIGLLLDVLKPINTIRYEWRKED